MRTLKLILLFSILSVYPFTVLVAQQDVIASSSNDEGTGGTVSWSLGLVAFQSLTSDSGSLLEGVQQPYEIYIVAGICDKETEPECWLFPNPATDLVTLKFAESNRRNLSGQLFDPQGKLLKSIAIREREASITLHDLNPSTLFLVILENEKPVKIFKIIKK